MYNQWGVQLSNVKEVKKRLAKKAANFKQVFESPNGADVLKALEEEFDKRLIGKDSYDTTVRAAQADVIVYIRQMMNFEYKGDDDEIEHS